MANPDYADQGYFEYSQNQTPTWYENVLMLFGIVSYIGGWIVLGILTIIAIFTGHFWN